MTVHDKRLARSHDDILEAIAAALDIPPGKFEEARQRYEALGGWLDRPESTLADLDPAISPHGSFLLGTVTRPLTDADEYDVDLVCRVNGSKAALTQKQLKDAVGHEVALYARARNMTHPEERRRCWTLNYAEGAQFHMDVLPALPDAQRYQAQLRAKGFGILAADGDLSGHAIAITDNQRSDYAVISDDWLQSNPYGYAAWFRSRMRVRLTEAKRSFAERERISASVDEIPDYKVRTPLQQAIQLLKRHRDCMFAEDGEHKPISIIITTLAAHAYNEEASLSAALQSILMNMDRYIEERDGIAWVSNPVNPAENFADKWPEEPCKRDNFFRWLAQARQDFAQYLRASPYDTIPDELERRLGPALVKRALNSIMRDNGAIGAPALLLGGGHDAELERARHAVDAIQSSGSQSRPWVR